MAEAVALGLIVLEGVIDGVDHGPFIADDTNILLRFEIDPACRSDPAYLGKGTPLPIEFTVQTDEEPPEAYDRWQRTVAAQGVHL